ncbi:MAG: decarboxylating 6-phosphogluconate dehydrogenase [Acidimicrobiia bacterium]|nr:decarboxylating 6-phosphogluconate dehydrogenase [Acidimicrobiia bacterium]MDH3396736.1 decarboxylating 6-phosphogluconate dehydrogenase [Acidimicrobiia bacterium]
MELAMIGLGKMGANMTERLVKGGHRVVGYDLNPESVAQIVEIGAEGAVSLEDLAGQLPDPQIVWIMVPAGGPVDQTIEAVLPFLRSGAVIIDGGNSYYRDTLRRAEQCDSSGVQVIDCGTSGGIWGLAEGYSMMVGGDQQVVENLRPIFETLAPAADQGWGRVGPAGSGHFVKMVHNGIEYGLMQAYAEGLAIMEAKEDFGLDLHQIAEIWRYGSVVRSWLLDLTADALAENPTMEGIAPFVPDSGEGRWTVFEAIDLNVAAPIITNSLFRRISSRDEESYADRILSAMRHKFGGHAIKSEDG